MDPNCQISKYLMEKAKNQSINFFHTGRINLIGEHTDYNGGHVLPGLTLEYRGLRRQEAMKRYI